MTATELGWLAGIFEGEGSLYFNVNKRSTGHWRAVIAMSDEDVIRRFHQLVGVGSVVSRCARVEGYKAQWTWQISAQEDVLNFCGLLAPHMGERRLAKMSVCINDLVQHGS